MQYEEIETLKNWRFNMNNNCAIELAMNENIYRDCNTKKIYTHRMYDIHHTLKNKKYPFLLI